MNPAHSVYSLPIPVPKSDDTYYLYELVDTAQSSPAVQPPTWLGSVAAVREAYLILVLAS